MSYTAPQYVDTKEKAVLALASTIAGEDKTGMGDGSVNTALDVLADVLAGQDVEVPQTNAGAILALAQYVQGGGQGGSGIEWETIYDEDVTFTYIAGSGSSFAMARNDTEDVPAVLAYGDVLVAEHDGVSMAAQVDALVEGASTMNVFSTLGGNTYGNGFEVSPNSGNTAVSISIFMGNATLEGADATLEAWCQTQHHITVKKCNVLA